MRIIAIALSAIAIFLAGCEKKATVERRPVPGADLEFFTRADKDLLVRIDVTQAPENFADVVFTWRGDLTKVPFDIYRHLGKNIDDEKVAHVEPGDVARLVLRQDLRPGMLHYYNVIKTADGEWKSSVAKLIKPDDLVIEGPTFRGSSQLRSRIYFRKGTRFIATVPNVLIQAGVVATFDDTVIESTERAPDIGDAVDPPPAMLRITAGRATGKLVLHAFGLDDVEHYADAPAVYLRVTQASPDFRYEIIQRPGRGGRRQPICVRIGGEVKEGCGNDWESFVTAHPISW